jgi:hypothetical protein
VRRFNGAYNDDIDTAFAVLFIPLLRPRAGRDGG